MMPKSNEEGFQDGDILLPCSNYSLRQLLGLQINLISYNQIAQAVHLKVKVVYRAEEEENRQQVQIAPSNTQNCRKQNAELFGKYIEHSYHISRHLDDLVELDKNLSASQDKLCYRLSKMPRNWSHSDNSSQINSYPKFQLVTYTSIPFDNVPKIYANPANYDKQSTQMFGGLFLRACLEQLVGYAGLGIYNCLEQSRRTQSHLPLSKTVILNYDDIKIKPPPAPLTLKFSSSLEIRQKQYNRFDGQTDCVDEYNRSESNSGSDDGAEQSKIIESDIIRYQLLQERFSTQHPLSPESIPKAIPRPLVRFVLSNKAFLLVKELESNKGLLGIREQSTLGSKSSAIFGFLKSGISGISSIVSNAIPKSISMFSSTNSNHYEAILPKQIQAVNHRIREGLIHLNKYIDSLNVLTVQFLSDKERRLKIDSRIVQLRKIKQILEFLDQLGQILGGMLAQRSARVFNLSSSSSQDSLYRIGNNLIGSAMSLMGVNSSIQDTHHNRILGNKLSVMTNYEDAKTHPALNKFLKERLQLLKKSMIKIIEPNQVTFYTTELVWQQ